LNVVIERVAKTEKTATMMMAALVTTPAGVLMPWATASFGGEAPVVGLLDSGDHKDVVIHGQAKEDDEREEWEP
jgi:membrane-associated PAP2 superfamily phosphatase